MTEADCVIPTDRISPDRRLRSYMQLFPTGMPEDCIAIVLNSVLKGINFIHLLHEGAEPDVNSSRIGVFFTIWERCPHTIRIAYHEKHMRQDDPERPQVGLWGAGIVALELAYGSLPENITPAQMLTMADNLVRVLRLKLQNNKKRIRHLPGSLQVLMDTEYVDRLEKKLKAEGIDRVAIALGSLMKGKGKQPVVEVHEPKKSFSRDFLDVVLKCLDKENPKPINQILDLVFLKNVFTNDMIYFEKRLRAAYNSSFHEN